MSDLSALFELPFFVGLPEERRGWLRANLSEHHLKKGNTLMREGQRVTHQFILLDGELVTEKMPGGRQLFDDRRVLLVGRIPFSGRF